MIVQNLEMRRGDLKPDLMIDLLDDNGAIPVSTASSVSVVATQNGTLLFKRAASTIADGLVTMEWQTTDTDVAGTIAVEVEIVWPGNKPQTIRPAGVVKVYPDLG